MLHCCCHLPNNVENISHTPNVPCFYNELGEVPSKIAPSVLRDPAPHAKTWFLCPTGVHDTPNDMLIGTVVFAGLTVVTNRQTHKTST